MKKHSITRNKRKKQAQHGSNIKECVLSGHLTTVRVTDDVICEGHVRRAPALQRDGVLAEVLQHVVDVGEPEVLHAALAHVVEGHAEVLGAALESPRHVITNCSHQQQQT